MSISCNAVRDIFVLYRDGALSPETESEVRAHIDSCGACREEYREMEKSYKNSTAKKTSPRTVTPPENLRFQVVAGKLRKNRIKKELISNTAWGLAVLGGVLITLAVYKGHINRHQGK